jgi:hypothetical protein
MLSVGLACTGCASSHVPVDTALPPQDVGETAERVVEVAASGGRTLALTSHGRVFSWGLITDGAAEGVFPTAEGYYLSPLPRHIRRGRTASDLVGDHAVCVVEGGADVWCPHPLEERWARTRARGRILSADWNVACVIDAGSVFGVVQTTGREYQILDRGELVEHCNLGNSALLAGASTVWYGPWDDVREAYDLRPIDVDAAVVGVGNQGEVALRNGHVIAVHGGGPDELLVLPGPVDSYAPAVPEVSPNFSGCAVLAGGEVHCWPGIDGNAWGCADLRRGPATSFHVDGVAAVQVDVGYRHACALDIDIDGRVWCWGYNGFGEVGDGSLDCRPAPVEVVLPLH